MQILENMEAVFSRCASMETASVNHFELEIQSAKKCQNYIYAFVCVVWGWGVDEGKSSFPSRILP